MDEIDFDPDEQRPQRRMFVRALQALVGAVSLCWGYQDSNRREISAPPGARTVSPSPRDRGFKFHLLRQRVRSRGKLHWLDGFDGRWEPSQRGPKFHQNGSPACTHGSSTPG